MRSDGSAAPRPRGRRCSCGTAPAAVALMLGLLVGACMGFGPMGPTREPGPALQPSADPAWYAENEALIAAYLETLPDSSIGKALPGIRLSDGNLWLEGYTYLGKPSDLPPGLSVRLVEKGNKVYAYLWLAEGAAPFQLDSCESGDQQGIRARRAGGGAHAWKMLDAGRGVVYTECPPRAWLEGEFISGRPAGVE